jgi:hypothetical protein
LHSNPSFLNRRKSSTCSFSSWQVGGVNGPKSILIYLLVEHQSKPQRFFMLRLAEYLLEGYKMQKRAWDEHHTSDAKLSLQPVLPIVLYTGDLPGRRSKPSWM